MTAISSMLAAACSSCLADHLCRCFSKLWLSCQDDDVFCCHLQPKPLRGFDEEVRNFVSEQYEVAGLHLHPEATPTEIQKGADGKVTLISETKQGDKVVLEGLDQVLLATGRKPNTKNLGCEEVYLPSQ